MTQNIYIGIAGWSYPDWQGIVYPSSKTDALAYASQYVDCIEINSTFYRPPSARHSQAWLDKTLDKQDFFFTAKLHQGFTHEGRTDPDLAAQIHQGFEPLIQAKRLKHLLAQFKYDFSDTPASRKQLQTIHALFSEAFDLVVEVRHKSWENPEALEFLNGLGVGVCNLDYPTTSNSFDLPHCTVGRYGYMRLHGRNTRAWFDKTAGRDETYNYDYSQPELTQIKDRLTQLADSFWHMVVIGNNHYKGAELANAIELKHLLTGRKQRVPPGLVKAYPRLERIAIKETPKGQQSFDF
ncbi:MAG: DUF72 domain-containing protein [Phycisphaerae bacterium]|nr:DUF72 domain-containing protein [Phycisphaerae bacterium]